MMPTPTPTPQQVAALRESLRETLVDQLANAVLQSSAVGHFSTPVLRLDISLQDGHDSGPSRKGKESWSGQPIMSRLVDISRFANSPSHTYPPPALPSLPNGQGCPDATPNLASPPPQPFPIPAPQTVTCTDGPHHHSSRSTLRPSRAEPPVQDATNSQRQIQVCDGNFPKRIKTQSAVPVPQETSLGKLVVGIWDHIHGGINLEPHSLLEQWRLTASLTTMSLAKTGLRTPGESGIAPPTPPPSECRGPTADADGTTSLSESSAFCRKITQASRTSRSVEVIVQARWVDHFDSHVAFLASTNPDMGPTKCRVAALTTACSGFNWSEKELRNKMSIWRGYKEIRDAGGWVALVFAGMGLYRLCKYRVGFNGEGMARLRALRPRLEVAADTLHPNWRQLLAIVGERSAQVRFPGHPHDWVVHTDGSEPVPLASTYRDLDPGFRFEHIDESVIDVNAWGADDPRWVPPPRPSASTVAIYRCALCGMEQDDDLKKNNCHCYPSLFGGPSSRPPVQVFHTANGKRNGVQALVPFGRGAAIGEFVGLVTKGIQDLDVMAGSAGGQEYQIWQGRQGNFTRFVNHSCNANAQFQAFAWRGTQRIVLVSKGIAAGVEVTVDYSRSYWRGLDKRCLCGEPCCRYNGKGRAR